MPSMAESRLYRGYSSSNVTPNDHDLDRSPSSSSARSIDASAYIGYCSFTNVRAATSASLFLIRLPSNPSSPSASRAWSSESTPSFLVFRQPVILDQFEDRFHRYGNAVERSP